MRVNPGLALTLFQTSWPWWVHNLINKVPLVVCFLNYLCNQQPTFKKFSWTSTSIIHIAKFRICTLFLATHIIYNRRVAYCSMMTSRKTFFVCATWKRFLVLKCYYDENHIVSIGAILRHKQVAYMRRKMLFTIFKYLFLFQRYSSL